MESIDRRLWSITARGLSEFVGDLAKAGILSSDVHTLARRFRERNLYPARDFEHRCQKPLPDIFITYDWRTNFVDLQATVWSGLDYVAGLLLEREPDLVTEPLVADGVSVWIDFMFIDQGARDLISELDVLPHLIASSDVHFLLSPTALTRAWCCYELALFNQRTANREDRSLISLVGPALLEYKLWSGVEATVPRDKEMIEQRIINDYPGGFTAFEYIMLQATLAGELAVHDNATTELTTAIDETRRAAEKWLTRTNTDLADAGK